MAIYFTFPVNCLFIFLPEFFFYWTFSNWALKMYILDTILCLDIWLEIFSPSLWLAFKPQILMQSNLSFFSLLPMHSLCYLENFFFPQVLKIFCILLKILWLLLFTFDLLIDLKFILFCIWYNGYTSFSCGQLSQHHFFSTLICNVISLGLFVSCCLFLSMCLCVLILLISLFVLICTTILI